jgi:hypothetical protein
VISPNEKLYRDEKESLMTKSNARPGAIVVKASGAIFAHVRVRARAGDGTPLLDENGRPKVERRWVDLKTRDVTRALQLLSALVGVLGEGETLSHPGAT